MRTLTAGALVLSAIALFLPTRSQTFTRVAVEGHAIRMLVRGSGESTVVFENGLGPPLEIWGKVQPRVSEFARTVSYDRAGVGLSEKGPSPRDGHQVARELRDALREAGVPPPYVLVGHSFGGLYIRVFAGMYPAEVSGMVLVDPTHEDAADFEPSLHPEMAVARETGEQARLSLIPPGVPLVLIDSVSPLEVPFATPTIRELRAKQRPEIEAESRVFKRWLDTIPGARLITTSSGHNIPVEEPRLVVDAIHEVVRSARSTPPLP